MCLSFCHSLIQKTNNWFNSFFKEIVYTPHSDLGYDPGIADVHGRW